MNPRFTQGLATCILAAPDSIGVNSSFLFRAVLSWDFWQPVKHFAQVQTIPPDHLLSDFPL